MTPDARNETIQQQAKKGYYLQLKVSKTAGNTMCETWKKVSQGERFFRWIGSHILPSKCLSTKNKCIKISQKRLQHFNDKPNTGHHQIPDYSDQVQANEHKTSLSSSHKTASSSSSSEDSPLEAYSVRINRVFSPEEVKPQDAPLLPEDFGLKRAFSDENSKFPKVPTHKKSKVRKATVEKVQEHFQFDPNNQSNLNEAIPYTEKGKKWLATFKDHIRFSPIQPGSCLADAKSNLITKLKGKAGFIFPGEVLAIPMQMHYDVNFNERKPAPKFYTTMHCSPAPCGYRYNGGRWDQEPSHLGTPGQLKDPANRREYVRVMKESFKAVIQTQVNQNYNLSICNAFGLGDYARKIFEKREDMYDLRKEITAEYIKAFEEVLDSMAPKERSEFKLLLTGPDGTSLEAAHQEEPRDNLNAFILAAANSRYRDHIIFCPEIDSGVLAQDLAEIIGGGTDEERAEVANALGLNGSKVVKAMRNKIAKSDNMVAISVVNAANSQGIGNKYFQAGAESAIDENLMRRSPDSATTACLLNEGLRHAPTHDCEARVNEVLLDAANFAKTV